MTIPLKTYDSDWHTKWDAVHKELQAHNATPYDDRTVGRGEQLVNQMHEAFHAQFQTTGDYAEWTEKNIRQAAEGEGMPDFRVPVISKESSVEATQRLYRLAVERIKIAGRAERNMLALAQPEQGEAFSASLAAGNTRITSAMSLAYNMPVFDDNNLVGSEGREASHSYLMEKLESKVNVCFFQVSGEGPSPINAIENLATKLYHAKFGTAALAKGGYRSPGNVDFYIYIPPLVLGDERYMRVGLSWDKESLSYFDPDWHHREAVPYVLRKQAAADGLAKDPDAPENPLGKGFRRSMPGKEF